MPKKSSKPAQKKSYILKEYVSDCYKNDMLYAAIVRSPLSSGKITNINFGDLPEGYILYTARDIPGKNRIVTLDTTTRVFCSEHVHYLGEPVGILVGPDLRTVRRLAKEIQITFDVTTIESALKNVAEELKKAPMAIQNQVTSKDSDLTDFVEIMNVMPSLDALPKPETNISYTQPSQITHAVGSINPTKHVQEVLAEKTIKTGFFATAKRSSTIEKYFTSSDYDICGSWTLNESTNIWGEANGAFCFTDNNGLNILTTTQWPIHLLKNISNVLNIEESKITIQKTTAPQESSNGIWRCTTLAAQTALASYLSQKPVKLLLTKEEQAKFMRPGITTKVTHRTSVNKDGTIKAMEIKFECDAGYANPFAKEIADRLAVAACSFYNIENIFIEVKVISSALPPTSIYSELIDSQAFFAVENQMQKICEVTHILPHELRIKNINTNPKTQKSPFIFHFDTCEEVLDAIMKQSDFLRKYTTYSLNSKENNLERGNTFFALPRRGIGLSCAYDGACFYGTSFSLSEQKMEVVLSETDSLTIKSVCPTNTASAIWKNIASSIMDIPVDQITIDSTETITSQEAMPENFYNDISIMTMLLKKCCQEIQKKRTPEHKQIISKKAITPAMKKQWNNETFSGTPFHSTAFGSAAVEVELNADTYKGKIKGIWIAIDCGEILSIKAAQSAIRLAVQQELKHLVKETGIECESVFISFVKSENPPCQIGKIVHNLIPAAFSSALSLAFSQPIESIPCTEQELYNLTTIQENVDFDLKNSTDEKQETVKGGEK